MKRNVRQIIRDLRDEARGFVPGCTKKCGYQPCEELRAALRRYRADRDGFLKLVRAWVAGTKGDLTERYGYDVKLARAKALLAEYTAAAKGKRW